MSPSRHIAMKRLAFTLGALALSSCGRYGFDPLGGRAIDTPESGCGLRCESRDGGGNAGSDAAGSALTDADPGWGPPEGGMQGSDGSIPDSSAPPPPPCTQGLFCSGFESRSLDDWDGTIALNGTTARTTDTVRRGTGALTAAASAPGGAAMRTKGGFGPFSTGSFYVRAHYFVPSATPTTEFALLTAGDVTLALSGGISVFVSNGRFALVADTGSVIRAGTLSVPVDQWFCAELALQISDRQGRATLWIDETQDNFLPGVPTLPLGGVTTIGVGIAGVGQGQSKARVLVDDVVVDTSPIGCN